MMKQGYGDFIKKHRLLNGYKSQRQFAANTNVSATTISRIESEVQKPQMETLHEIAPFLPTTSIVELMVVCGYWDKEDLLEDIDTEDSRTKELQYEKTPSNEEAFVKDVQNTNNIEDLLNQYNLELDGKKLTKAEAQGVIAYLRTLRGVNPHN